MILVIGEILIDLIGTTQNGTFSYERHAGGAPFNVACGLSKYGSQVSFIGNVGNDLPGKYLVDVASKMKFGDCQITCDELHNTTMAFVENDDSGERNFCFYRKNTADYFIETKALELIKFNDIIHFGSLMLSEGIGRNVADEIIKMAWKHGKKVSFDINFREDIYHTKEEALSIYQGYAKQADIVKYSLDELCMFTKTKTIEEAQKFLNPKQAVFVTLGKEGSVLFYQNKRYQAASISIKAVDTTGCGDAFYAGILRFLDSKSLDEMTAQEISRMLRFANICGALVATKKGAIDSIPTLEEIMELM